jgi:hypothetical protein
MIIFSFCGVSCHARQSNDFEEKIETGTRSSAIVSKQKRLGGTRR